MEKEKKALIKNFKTVIEDLMDHYEEYTEAEKSQIKEIFQKVSELNTILDKYDIETEFDWQDYFDTVCKCFGASWSQIKILDKKETSKYKNQVNIKWRQLKWQVKRKN